MKKSKLAVIILLISFQALFGQDFNPRPFTINSGVDIEEPEIKTIVDLWENYLNSKPDSSYNNPYWSIKEMQKYDYKNFDIGGSLIYNQSSAKYWRYFYKPIVLSVKKENEVFRIKTIFYYDNYNREGELLETNVSSILTVYAKKENDQWKLFNTLPFLTANWNRKQIGSMTFIYPSSHEFNEPLAIKTVRFADSICDKFDLERLKPIEFYVTKDNETVHKLMGLEYFIGEGNITTSGGRALWGKDKLLAGNGSEWYPHELLHLIFEKYKTHSILVEGIASWLGGHLGKDINWHILRINDYLNKNPDIDLSDLKAFAYTRIDSKTNPVHFMGAILCRIAHEKKVKRR